MRNLALLSSLFLAACVVQSRPTNVLPWRIDRRLVLGEPGRPQVILEADWRLEGNRYCVSRAPVDLVTPAGPLRLNDAELCATQRPPAILGDAEVPLPALGIVAAITGGPTPRGRISLARGRDLQALVIGNERLPVEPSHFYLTVDYAGRYDVALGRASLSIGGPVPRMIVDPEAPVFYFAGDLAGLLPASMAGVVFGLSPTGGLPYASAQPLFDGTTSAVRRLDGHLFVQGTFRLGDLLAVTGRVVLDLDANDDGRSAIGGEAGDLLLGGDVILRLAYAVAALRVDVEIARASLWVDASGATYFAGSVPATVLGATSLASFSPATDLAIRGVVRSGRDFALLLAGDGRLLGLPFSRAEVELRSDGAALRGRLEIPRLGPVDVAGAVATDGAWAVAGRAPDVSIAGLPLSGIEVTASPRGAFVAAGTRFAGVGFRVAGGVTPGGDLALSGTMAPTPTTRVGLALDARGVRAAFEGRVCVGGVCVEVPPTEIDTQGNVCPTFPLVGRRCVKVL